MASPYWHFITPAFRDSRGYCQEASAWAVAFGCVVGGSRHRRCWRLIGNRGPAVSHGEMSHDRLEGASPGLSRCSGVQASCQVSSRTSSCAAKNKESWANLGVVFDGRPSRQVVIRCGDRLLDFAGSSWSAFWTYMGLNEGNCGWTARGRHTCERKLFRWRRRDVHVGV